MAGPFGGHPTLHKYLDWLHQQGFQYKTGYVELADRTVHLVTVQDADGKDVFNIGDVPMNERLAPAQVSYYDSIFGMDSPFPKTPR